jgi:hypothetical protein
MSLVIILKNKKKHHNTKTTEGSSGQTHLNAINFKINSLLQPAMSLLPLATHPPA